MNTDLEERLVDSMQHEAGSITLTGDVLGRATRRHRRRITAMRAGYALGATGLAAALAVGLTGSIGPAPKPPVVQAQSPAMRLVSAATASEGISYRFRYRMTSGSGKDLSAEGAFDPRTDTGYLRRPGEVTPAELLIGENRYFRIDGDQRNARYVQSSDERMRLPLAGPQLWFVDAIESDPAFLFKTFRDAATVTENPDGSMHFEAEEEIPGLVHSITGDVRLDVDGRVAKIEKTTVSRTKDGKSGNEGGRGISLELFDYGLPVTVERPGNVVSQARGR